MKKTHVVLLMMLLAACGGAPQEEKKTQAADTTAKNDVLRDTVTFTITDIDENLYCKTTKKMGFCDGKNDGTWSADSLREVKLIEKSNDVVKRDGDKLFVKYKNGKHEFKDVRDEMSGEYVIYQLSDITDKFVVMRLQYYEGHEYMVVNLETGKSFRTWGMPVFNADGTMAIAGNYDLMAGFTNNGLQLFTSNGSGWELKMQKILDDWGPSHLYWLNDSVILAKKIMPDETDTITGLKIAFVKIMLRKERLD